MKLSVLEQKRISNVNHIMNELNESVACIYENLIDQEYSELNTEITQLITKLKHMKDNLQDEF
jgi:hypothetical protein|tara:strand:- start:169 stop:357 length:189 start_codon:yes stop_codon:yes gene_type:complete